MYQRIVIVTFKDELSKASMTSYLHPIIKQQGEAYGLIAMTSTQITELSILTTYLWPDYETAKAAREEYGAKIVDALRKAGAKAFQRVGGDFSKQQFGVAPNIRVHGLVRVHVAKEVNRTAFYAFGFPCGDDKLRILAKSLTVYGVVQSSIWHCVICPFTQKICVLRLFH